MSRSRKEALKYIPDYLKEHAPYAVSSYWLMDMGNSFGIYSAVGGVPDGGGYMPIGYVNYDGVAFPWTHGGPGVGHYSFADGSVIPDGTILADVKITDTSNVAHSVVPTLPDFPVIDIDTGYPVRKLTPLESAFVTTNIGSGNLVGLSALNMLIGDILVGEVKSTADFLHEFTSWEWQGLTNDSDMMNKADADMKNKILSIKNPVLKGVAFTTYEGFQKLNTFVNLYNVADDLSDITSTFMGSTVMGKISGYISDMKPFFKVGELGVSDSVAMVEGDVLLAGLVGATAPVVGASVAGAVTYLGVKKVMNFLKPIQDSISKLGISHYIYNEVSSHNSVLINSLQHLGVIGGATVLQDFSVNHYINKTLEKLPLNIGMPSADYPHYSLVVDSKVPPNPLSRFVGDKQLPDEKTVPKFMVFTDSGASIQVAGDSSTVGDKDKVPPLVGSGSVGGTTQIPPLLDGDKDKIQTPPLITGGGTGQVISPPLPDGDKDKVQTPPLPDGDKDKVQIPPLPGGDKGKIETPPLPGGDKGKIETPPLPGGDKTQTPSLPSGDKSQTSSLPDQTGLTSTVGTVPTGTIHTGNTDNTKDNVQVPSIPGTGTQTQTQTPTKVGEGSTAVTDGGTIGKVDGDINSGTHTEQAQTGTGDKAQGFTFDFKITIPGIDLLVKAVEAQTSVISSHNTFIQQNEYGSGVGVKPDDLPPRLAEKKLANTRILEYAATVDGKDKITRDGEAWEQKHSVKGSEQYSDSIGNIVSKVYGYYPNLRESGYHEKNRELLIHHANDNVLCMAKGKARKEEKERRDNNSSDSFIDLFTMLFTFKSSVDKKALENNPELKAIFEHMESMSILKHKIDDKVPVGSGV